MAVALSVVVLHKYERAGRGQVAAGHVFGAQELQAALREALPDQLSPPEFNHLRHVTPHSCDTAAHYMHVAKCMLRCYALHSYPHRNSNTCAMSFAACMLPSVQQTA